MNEPVMAYNGRFGPYVKCGEETRSLPADVSPLDVTLEQAVALAGPAEAHGRGRAAAKREPLKVFDASPVTGEKVQLLDGRYGPYVTDGETNASLPKGTSAEELTLPKRSTCSPRGPPSVRRKRKPLVRRAAAALTAKKKSATNAKRQSRRRKTVKLVVFCDFRLAAAS